MLQLKDISKSINKKIILNKTNIIINKGDCVYISGNNGAGKSTLLLVISGILKQDSGDIVFKGNNMRLCLQKIEFDSDLTVYENLLFISQIEKISIKQFKEQLKNIQNKLNFNIDLNINFNKLSGGNKQKVLLSSVLFSNPDLIMFDEPTNALDFSSQEAFYNIISYLKDQGKTLIITTHFLNENIKKLFNKILILKEGQLLTC